jgi:hypothetical protein
MRMLGEEQRPPDVSRSWLAQDHRPCL